MATTEKRKPGRPLVGQRKRVYNMTLNPELVENLDKIANEFYMSRSALVGQVLSDFVRRTNGQ